MALKRLDKKNLNKATVFLILLSLSIVMLLPIILTVFYSFEGTKEIESYFAQYTNNEQIGIIKTKILEMNFIITSTVKVLCH